ncbi:unnamed protein product [Oncorhynchus mykiss]|uniref:BTB domain-containing protein n=1 Tax=Oncorhynchus mykiss TaxID=8022 RepID=A0A060XJ34_ONCMY|nr:unnamed protein product [Oncorhynchus mykiss]
MGISAHLQASKTGNTRFFTSNTHSSVVLQGFDQLRIEGLLCDVTLVAGDGDEAFPVHRAMMASSSDYFKAMFTGKTICLCLSPAVQITGWDNSILCLMFINRLSDQSISLLVTHLSITLHSGALQLLALCCLVVAKISF